MGKIGSHPRFDTGNVSAVFGKRQCSAWAMAVSFLFFSFLLNLVLRLRLIGLEVGGGVITWEAKLETRNSEPGGGGKRKYHITGLAFPLGGGGGVGR